MVVGGALIARAVFQGCVFLLSARMLEPEKFGLFTACLAVVAIMAQWLDSGPVFLMIVDSANDPASIRQHWGRSASVLKIIQPWMLVMAMVVEYLLFNDSVGIATLGMLTIAELGFGVWTSLGLRILQASERVLLMALMAIAIVLVRLLMLLGFVLLVAKAELIDWALVYLMSAIAAQILMHLVCKAYIGEKLPGRISLKVLKRSLYFSLGGLAGKLRGEADKVVIVKLIDPATAGFYTAAHRVMDIFALPLYGFLEVILSRLFASSSGGYEKFKDFSKRTLPWPLAYALLVMVVVCSVADYAVWLLGGEYEKVVPMLQLMSCMPMLILVRLYFSHALAGAGKNQSYAMVQIVGALVNVIGNLIFVKSIGWFGAWLGAVCTEIAMIMLAVKLLVRSKNEVRRSMAG